MHRLSVLLVAVLAGCTAPDPSGPAATYDVPVEIAHAINGADRIVTVVVSQGGEELGRATYSSAGKAQDDFETLFTVQASAGPLKIEVLEGANPLNFKSIDPARCSGPDFQVHIIDDQVHLWSNCD